MGAFLGHSTIHHNTGIFKNCRNWKLTVIVTNVGTEIIANSVEPDQAAPQEQPDQGLHCLPLIQDDWIIQG